MNTSAKKNPVQIVLNASNFIDLQVRTAGGKNRDFFASHDDEFAAHKTKLTTQVVSIQKAIQQSGNSAAYVKVRLRREAWAKSHRPTKKLFAEQLFPSAGVDGIGEIYYRVNAQKMPSLVSLIQAAEPATNIQRNPRTGKDEAMPSRLRSEVGAIEDVFLPQEADRRAFSTNEALSWLGDGRSGRMYILDLFDMPRTMADFLSLPRDEQDLYEHLVETLNGLPFGVSMFRSSVTTSTINSFLFVRLAREKRALSINSYFTPSKDLATASYFDDNSEHHEQLIKVLSRHPLVRRVMLPPLIQSHQQGVSSTPLVGTFPTKSAGVRYPRVGVVDAGIGAGYSTWVLGAAGLIDNQHRNEQHGSFIAGLLVGARAAGNSLTVATESDGCELFDIDIFPDHNQATVFEEYYPNGFVDFLQELDLAVAVAKQKHGIRVFNVSLNLQQQVDEVSYSPFAALLDGIAERHDVIIVISAGNLLAHKMRGPWPTSPERVASHLLPHAGGDRLLQPSESVFAVTVGAINPPGADGHIDYAPAPYTRRGPGLKVGVKPDICHFGGTTRIGSAQNESLFSIEGDGRILSGMGTSYAAPLAAKTLASLENQIEGPIPRETLVALLIHKAQIPAVLDHPELRTIARHFVGFGLPAGSGDTLLTDPSSITMVFNSVITAGRELRFNFAWPAALVSAGGRCRGAAQLTLVYRPPVEASYGAEFVRVNLDIHLRQHQGNGHYKGCTQQVFMQGSDEDAHFESDLIEHGLKWWPVKHHLMYSPKGIGKSSEWRLVVEPLLRDGADFPAAGVPFCAILTISDPKKEKAVFDEMRVWLGANSVKCDDIRTATRVRSQGGT